MSKPTAKINRTIRSEQVLQAFVEVVRRNLPLELKNTRITSEDVIYGEQYAIVDTRSGLGLGSFPAVAGTEVVKEIMTLPDLGYEPGVSPSYDRTRKTILGVLVLVIAAIILVVILLVHSEIGSIEELALDCSFRVIQ